MKYGPKENTFPSFENYFDNPIYPNENYWAVSAGHYYEIGIEFESDGWYMSIRQMATGVDELNGDKTVAGVRYFNMTGQEMQEADGMAIVVTTYTDGTTTVVKLMK